jgi:hypothetical protein
MKQTTATKVLALIVFLASGGLSACAPSEAAIRTAIAQTQAALPTATVTPKLTLTPAPTMTPRPAPITVKPKELLPQSSDLPIGFELNAKSSGPIDVDDGDGYVVSYMNPNNILSTNGDAIFVTIQVSVLNSEEAGHSYYSIIKTNAPSLMNEMLPQASENSKPLSDFTPTDAKISNTDESVLIIGTIQGPLFPATICNVTMRMKNVVVSVYIGASDVGDAKDTLQRQAKFYISLVMDKVSP